MDSVHIWLKLCVHKCFIHFIYNYDAKTEQYTQSVWWHINYSLNVYLLQAITKWKSNLWLKMTDDLQFITVKGHNVNLL